MIEVGVGGRSATYGEFWDDFGMSCWDGALETIINADTELIERAVLGVPSEVGGQEASSGPTD